MKKEREVAAVEVKGTFNAQRFFETLALILSERKRKNHGQGDAAAGEARGSHGSKTAASGRMGGGRAWDCISN